MSFNVDWHPNVRKILKKLPPEVSRRIIKKVKDTKENPFRYLEHFEGKGLYKLRVGDYRLLIDVDFKSMILNIQVLDKRGRIYKR